MPLPPGQPALADGLPLTRPRCARRAPCRRRPGPVFPRSYQSARRDELNLNSLLHADAAPPAALLPSVAPSFSSSSSTKSTSRVDHARSSCRSHAEDAAQGSNALRPWPSPATLPVYFSSSIKSSRLRTSVSTVPQQGASSSVVRTAASEWCRSLRVLTMSSTAT